MWLAIKMLPWRYIGPALGGALILIASYNWAHERGQRSRDKEVADLVLERKAAQANVATLEADIDRYNDAVALAEAKGKAAQDMAAQAARQAQERDRALASMKRRLEVAARPAAPVAGCVVPDAVADAWGVM